MRTNTHTQTHTHTHTHTRTHNLTRVQIQTESGSGSWRACAWLASAPRRLSDGCAAHLGRPRDHHGRAGRGHADADRTDLCRQLGLAPPLALAPPSRRREWLGRRGPEAPPDSAWVTGGSGNSILVNAEVGGCLARSDVIKTSGHREPSACCPMRLRLPGMRRPRSSRGAGPRGLQQCNMTVGHYRDYFESWPTLRGAHFVR